MPVNPFDDLLGSPDAGSGAKRTIPAAAPTSGFSRQSGRHTGTRDPFEDAAVENGGGRGLDSARVRGAQEFSLDPFFDE